MIPMQATTEPAAKREAVAISKKHPGKYVTIHNCFGLYAGLHSRLCVFAPSDSIADWYVLNGKLKPFTERQRIADQNASPTMS